MPTMTKLTLFKRLVLGFLIILLVFTALGLYSTLKLDQLNRMIHSISAVDNETIRIANRLKDLLLTQRSFEKKYVVSQDRDFYQQFLETDKYIRKDISTLGRLAYKTKKAGLINQLTRFYDEYVSTVKAEAAIIEKGRKYANNKYGKEKEHVTNQIIQGLDILIKTAKTAIDTKITVSEKTGSQASRVVALITIASIILCILIAFFNARTVNRPITQLIKGTKEIAKGRFEKHFTVTSPPEINELANAFNYMCDRLKDLDEMKADLVSHISHEFRTPLAVIREAVSLYREGISTNTTERQIRLTGIIEEECERLINAVNKMLNLSRMDAGMMDYHIEEFSLSDLIEKSVSKIIPISERKQISLEINLDDGLPNAAVDAENIGQVLDNLLDNALKFTPAKGNISVQAELKGEKGSKERTAQKKRFIEVSVSDSGCGIPTENISDIFDKFKKLNEKGTGLGLYIARQIVEGHGGDIWARSDGRTGSTFFFTVPVF